jgi:uncharacterized protein YjbJ (UPF0337 family)
MGIGKDGAKNQAKGIAKEVKGKVNEMIGVATGDRSRELKGKVQKHVGRAQQQMGRTEQKLAK